MPETDMRTCSVCGRAIDRDVKCEECGQPLCHYDIRVLDGRTLCPKHYKEETFQYRSRECDIMRH